MFQFAWKNRAAWRRDTESGAVGAPPPGPAVRDAAVLVWEEHCVECAVPHCYASCPLYVRRGDGQCRRFAYGIYPDRRIPAADIRFRRWGKLEAWWPERPRFAALDDLHRMERHLDRLERLRGFGFREALRKARKRRIRREGAGEATADALSIRVHAEAAVRLQLEIDREGALPKANRLLFRRALDLVAGWNAIDIAASELPPGPGKIRLWPDGDAEVRLVFARLDLVRFADGPAPTIKCVAWDLDGTLWRGIIGEDGPDGVEPDPQALDLVRRLDERGILQTIASRNTHAVAWPKIEELGLADMFLHPAIHWGPKSVSLRRVAEALNIDVNSFAFIDDSAFERAEVADALPQVRTYDAAGIGGLLERAEFDVPVTEAARSRRHSYLAEAQRRRVGEDWGGDHAGFLRRCNMELRIAPPSVDERSRCLELLQRSNQFNLSGRRYTEAALAALVDDPAVRGLALPGGRRFRRLRPRRLRRGPRWRADRLRDVLPGRPQAHRGSLPVVAGRHAGRADPCRPPGTDGKQRPLAPRPGGDSPAAPRRDLGRRSHPPYLRSCGRHSATGDHQRHRCLIVRPDLLIVCGAASEQEDFGEPSRQFHPPGHGPTRLS